MTVSKQRSKKAPASPERTVKPPASKSAMGKIAATKGSAQVDDQSPRWIQAMRWLRTSIDDRTLHGRLPSEPELAERLGISYMTMRRAVGELVTEGLLERRQGAGTFVREGATEIRRAIGFCIHGNVHGGIGNPFYAPVVQAAVDEARRHRHGIIAIADSFPGFFTGPARTPVCGIIGLAVPPERITEASAAMRQVPVVLIDSARVPAGASGVRADDAQGAALAAVHLAGLGHRQIAYLAGNSGSQITGERVTAFLGGLRSAGVEPDARLVLHGDYEFNHGYLGAGRLFAGRQRPTAIFCANDTVAFGVLRRCAELGIRVPQDVSVVGFGGLEQATLLPVPLTTVAIPQDQLGWAAWHEMERLLADGVADPAVLVATTLQLGGTTGAPA